MKMTGQIRLQEIYILFKKKLLGSVNQIDKLVTNRPVKGEFHAQDFSLHGSLCHLFYKYC